MSAAHNVSNSAVRYSRDPTSNTSKLKLKDQFISAPFSALCFAYSPLGTAAERRVGAVKLLVVYGAT